MNSERRKVLLEELVILANKGHYFVSMETDQEFFRGLAPATPRVCIGILLKGESMRPTVTAGPMISDHPLPDYGSVVYRTLTDVEKEEICRILGGIAQKINARPKLLKKKTESVDGLLFYRFR